MRTNANLSNRTSSWRSAVFAIGFLFEAALCATAAQPLLQINNLPLSGAISNLARQANLNYILDPRASSASIGPSQWLIPETPVSCQWENSTPDQALIDLLKRH